MPFTTFSAHIRTRDTHTHRYTHTHTHTHTHQGCGSEPFPDRSPLCSVLCRMTSVEIQGTKTQICALFNVDRRFCPRRFENSVASRSCFFFPLQSIVTREEGSERKRNASWCQGRRLDNGHRISRRHVGFDGTTNPTQLNTSRALDLCP